MGMGFYFIGRICEVSVKGNFLHEHIVGIHPRPHFLIAHQSFAADAGAGIQQTDDLSSLKGMSLSLYMRTVTLHE